MPVDLEWCISSHFAQSSFDLKGIMGISAGGFKVAISFKVIDLLVKKILELGVIQQLIEKEQRAQNFKHDGDGQRKVCPSGMQDLKKCTDKVEAITDDQEGNGIFCFHRR
jgi:hypothetical protein